MTPLGLALAAPVADVLGVRIWYAVGGLACVAAGLIGSVLPSLQHFEEAEDPELAAVEVQAEG